MKEEFLIVVVLVKGVILINLILIINLNLLCSTLKSQKILILMFYSNVTNQLVTKLFLIEGINAFCFAL